MLLHAVKHDSQQIRAFRTDRILGVAITAVVFVPSYRVDLISSGPVKLS